LSVKKKNQEPGIKNQDKTDMGNQKARRLLSWFLALDSWL